MLVLGIDPGTAITGYGLVTETLEGSLRAVDYGVITTPKGLSLPLRLLELNCRLKELLLLHQPDTSAVEKLYFQKNAATAFAVGQARGVVLLALAEAGLEVGEYSPMEVKQAVVGFGNAEKKQIQKMVQALLELPKLPRPDDAADALAVAICHLNSARYYRGALEGGVDQSG